MPDSERKFCIFISGTSRDLKKARQKTVSVILQNGHIPIEMSYFLPDGKSTSQEVIETYLGKADALILLIGQEYGSLVPGKKKSYTHLEYELAKNYGLPVLAFLTLDESKIKEESAIYKFRKQVDRLCNRRFNPREPSEIVTSIGNWISKELPERCKHAWARVQNIAPVEEHDWVLDKKKARTRLEELNISPSFPRHLYKEGSPNANVFEDLKGVMDEIRGDLARSPESNVAILHGRTGAGKTTTLLSLGTSLEREEGHYLFIDCAANQRNYSPTEGIDRLGDNWPSTRDKYPIYVVIDGLDVALQREWTRKKLLEEEQTAGLFFTQLRTKIEDLNKAKRRRIFMLFSIEDRIDRDIDTQDLGVVGENKIIPEIRKIDGKFLMYQLSLLKPDKSPSWKEFENLYSNLTTAIESDKHHLRIPIFADALNKIHSGGVLGTKHTKFALLRDATGGNTLKAYAHEYYEVAKDVQALEEALHRSEKEPDWVEGCVRFLTEEKPWIWLDLVESGFDMTLCQQLWKLHDKLLERRWLFAHTSALSNVVSVLSRLDPHRKHSSQTKDPFEYNFCNLQGAWIAGKSSGAIFRGSDLRSASLEGMASSVQPRFIGSDIDNAELPPTVKGSQLIDCLGQRRKQPSKKQPKKQP